MRAITLAVWALAAASLVYWGLRLARGSATAVHVPPAIASIVIDPLSVARVLGATAAQALPQASFAAGLCCRVWWRARPAAGLH